jgi:uncharacterized protein
VKKDDIIEKLRSHQDEIRANGVTGLYLYGSQVRSEARRDSDVDLFFDRAPEARMGLFKLLALQRRLEEILGKKVDLGTREGLHRVLKADIEESAARVF